MSKEDLKNYKAPVLDRESSYAEIGGMELEGVKYQQGRNYFSPGGHFVKECKGPGLPEETPEQKKNRQIQAMKNKKFFGKKATPAEIPRALLDAERENAQARAAESLSG